MEAKIASNVAKNKEIVDQQATAIAAEMERHLKTIEAAHDEFGRMIEANLKESAEAEAKLQALTERYEADYNTLDAKMAASVTVEPIPPQQPSETRAAPPRLPLAPLVPDFIVDSMQAHMQATGVTSPEQLALVPQMMAIMNAMLAANPAQTPTPKDDSAITQDADADGVEAQAKIALKKERLAEEEEVLKLNASPAAPTYSAGKPGRQSDRVSPMS